MQFHLRNIAPALAAAAVLPFAAQSAEAAPQNLSFRSGNVYTSTNQIDSNDVAMYRRGRDGAIRLLELVPTGGKGTGMGLGNQGAVTLSENEQWLYVVNAGTNDVSVFTVGVDELTLVERVFTQGMMPVSVAQHDDLVYVVNAESNSIAGFRQQFDGTLSFIQGSVEALSSTGTAPAQIGFSPDGSQLYVTEKATNVISNFTIDAAGVPVSSRVLASNGETPFGFAFGLRGQLFVSEAFGGAPGLGSVSAYGLTENGDLDTISDSFLAQGTATCWVAATPSGRLVFVSNTGSDTISSFSAGFDGRLRLLDPQAANTGAGPLDVALTRNGQFFYVLNGAAGGIGDYRVEQDGALTSLPGSNGGLPPGASGLAAR